MDYAFSDDAELRGEHLVLEVRTLHVGAVTREGPHFPARDLPGFVGQMQQLHLNGQPLFEMARQGHIPNLQVVHSHFLGTFTGP